ncbi:YycH family regulatory protein [Staphylococcus pseudintermedius]
MRTRELIKSIVLALLVLSSIVLTVMIWNFSPDLTDADNVHTKDATEAIGTRYDKAFSQVVTPLQLVHIENDDVKGMPANKDVNALMTVFQKHRIIEVEDIQNDDVVLLRNLSNHFVVLDYPSDIPLSMYLNEVIEIPAKVPTNFKFNRLILDVDDAQHVIIYAMQPNHQRAIKLETNLNTKHVQKRIQKMKADLEPYSNVVTNRSTINKATYMYAVKAPKNLKAYRTIFNRINVEDLNAILFDNTPIVRTTNSGNTTYNNNTGVVNYNANRETYDYTNLSEDEHSTRNMNVNLPRAFDFINKHGGFTDDFRLFSANNDRGHIIYQMFLNGRPIFYPNQLNEIRVLWGERGLYEYSRGLLKTNVTIDNGEKPESLPDLEDVRSVLASKGDIDFTKVQQMVIGYRMNPIKGPENSIEIQEGSQFIPTWYIQYDHEWYEYKDGELIET